MILSNDCIWRIKYFVFIIIYSNLAFINYIYINIEHNHAVEIDNDFKLDPYENETIYQKKSKLKPIEIYYPECNNISYFKYFNKSFDSKISSNEIELLENTKVNLAKNHQIYGFIIDHDTSHTNIFTNETMNIFLNKIQFPFFLLWRNDKIHNDKTKIKCFFDNIKKYIISENYIKIRNKPALVIKSLKNIKNRKSFISSIRIIVQEIIGEIFLIYPFTDKLTEESKFNEFDGTYDFSRLD